MSSGRKGRNAYLICMEREETGAATRECTKCRQEKPYTIEHWPNAKGNAVGSVCRLCSRLRKRDFDLSYKQKRVAARTQSMAQLAETPAVAPAKSVAVSLSRDAKDGELPLRQLEVAKALRVGAKRLNEAAQGILETILEYAGNSQSPHHEWALRLVAERVIPRKLYEDLGAQAAGIKAGQGTVRPAVTIIVQGASPAAPEPSIRVIEGESERVAVSSDVRQGASE